MSCRRDHGGTENNLKSKSFDVVASSFIRTIGLKECFSLLLQASLSRTKFICITTICLREGFLRNLLCAHSAKKQIGQLAADGCRCLGGGAVCRGSC